MTKVTECPHNDFWVNDCGCYCCTWCDACMDSRECHDSSLNHKGLMNFYPIAVGNKGN